MTIYEWSALLFASWCLFRLVTTLGKKLNIQEAIAAITGLVYLAMPVVAYNIFNEQSKLALLWKTTMPITSDEYFGFALPSVMALTLGLLLPFKQPHHFTDKDLLLRVEEYLSRKTFIGYLFILIGIISSVVLPWIPSSLWAVVYFAGQLLYIGVMYLIFSKIPFKGLILSVAFLFLIVQTINTGMYGSMIFWGFLMLLYLLLRRREVKLPYKIMMLFGGVFLLFLIQSIKHEYREKTWQGSDRQGDAIFFMSLLVERITNPASVFELERVYGIATRGNQGFLLARTLEYVPKHEPFAEGETILLSVQASIVPRLFWKDKPALGGLENTCRFLGDCGKRDYSYNIGQVGEAYVNFGRWGGVVFMFFYGLFVNWSLWLVKKVSIRYPTVILWIPLMFFASLSLETDLLTFLNTLIKGVIFCWMVYLFFKYVLKWRI